MLAGRPKRQITEFDQRIAHKLRTVRLTRHMSQMEVAKALGVTFQQVQKYEKGTNRISPARLAMAAKLFEKPAAFFFDPVTNVNMVPDCISIFATKKDAVALAEAFNAIRSPDVRHAFVALAQSTAGAKL